MKYNCCQVSDICPKNKVCQRMNSLDQPWKRFTCECRDGYNGDSCSEPIMSCAGYANGHRRPGLYEVVDPDGQVYEVYCHFDSDGAWTLVQSYSFANRAMDQFKRPLSENLPFNENGLKWSGYRLSKAKMKWMTENSVLLRFTCDYEKHHNVSKSDFVEVPLHDIQSSGGDKVDILYPNITSDFWTRQIFPLRGKIGKNNLYQCQITFFVSLDWTLLVHVNYNTHKCNVKPRNCLKGSAYFGSYYGYTCFDEAHSCAQNANSTTQLWLGKR